MKMLNDLGIYLPLVAANVVVFLVFFFVIRSVLFERVRAHMQGRDESLQGLREELSALAAKQSEAEAELTAARVALQERSYERTQEQVRKGLERKAQLVREAHEQSMATLKAARAACLEDKQAAMTGGRAEIEALALEVARLATAGAVGKAALKKAVAAAAAKRFRGGAA